MSNRRNAGALPPAPEPAGAPEQPVSTETGGTGARRCRSCGAALTETCRFLCAACRDASAARQREKRRIRARSRYTPSGRPRLKSTAEPCARGLADSPGASDGCGPTGNGGRESRPRLRYVDPLPPGPPTSMSWLHAFDGWAKSGLSYAEYQAAEKFIKKERTKHHDRKIIEDWYEEEKKARKAARAIPAEAKDDLITRMAQHDAEVKKLGGALAQPKSSVPFLGSATPLSQASKPGAQEAERLTYTPRLARAESTSLSNSPEFDRQRRVALPYDRRPSKPGSLLPYTDQAGGAGRVPLSRASFTVPSPEPGPPPPEISPFWSKAAHATPGAQEDGDNQPGNGFVDIAVLKALEAQAK